MANLCNSTIDAYYPHANASLKGAVSELCDGWDPSGLSPWNWADIWVHSQAVKQTFEAAANGEVDEFIMLKAKADKLAEGLNGEECNAFKRFALSLWNAIDMGQMYHAAFKKEINLINDSTMKDPHKVIGDWSVPNWDLSWKTLERAEYYLNLTPYATEGDIAKVKKIRSSLAFFTVYRCYRTAQKVIEEDGARECSPALRNLYQCLETLNPYVRWPVSKEHMEPLHKLCKK